MAPSLSPQAKRLRTIIVAVPIMGATAFVLYKRLVLGEPRRTLQPDQPIVQLNPYKETESSGPSHTP